MHRVHKAGQRHFVARAQSHPFASEDLEGIDDWLTLPVHVVEAIDQHGGPEAEAGSFELDPIGERAPVRVGLAPSRDSVPSPRAQCRTLDFR